MAGIGFVLQKLIRTNSLSGLFRAVIAGAIIVAGPWLVSVGGISIISELSFGAMPDDPRLFSFAIVICYIASLIAFGGFHYLYSRSVADFVYERKRADAAQALLASSLIVGVLSVAMGAGAAALSVSPAISQPGLYAAGMVALFVAVNLGWLLMLFASLIRRYILLFFCYAGAMAASVALALLLAPAYGSGGALAGFAAGQLLLCALLYAIELGKFKPAGGSFKGAMRALGKYAGLLLAGSVFVWGFWADKVVFWVFFGTPVPGTAFALYDRYDMAVFNANLSTIPGLVYFVITTETGFFRELRSFIKGVETEVFRNIQLRKYRLAMRMREGLFEQSVFQAALSVAFILLAPDALTRVALAGAAVYLFLLTVVVFLFYLQAFYEVLLASSLFLFLNAGLALASGWFGQEWAVGWGFIAAALAASLLALFLLTGLLRRYDRIVFIRSTVRLPQLAPMIRGRRKSRAK